MHWRCAVVLLLITSTGCQQRTASKLQGRWEGRPESAAARAAREAEKYGDAPSSTDRSESKTDPPAQVTDWENYDVTILIDFVSSNRLEMSLGNDHQPRSATWQIIATSLTGCTIEVQTESATDKNQDPTTERRRFDLVLDEREGTCVGFLLTEVGADRQLGTIYFKRPE